MAKDIPEEQLKAICRLKPTLKDVAAFFQCSEDTIERRCKTYGNCTFAEFREQNMVHTRFDLIRKAMRMAETNPTMMIFCLKNICKWVDKHDVDIAQVKPFEFGYPNKKED
jgi:AraC-like DNA-binding protein